MQSCLAVDIGGTKVAAGIVDSTGHVLTEARRETPGTADAEGVFAAVLDVAARALGREGALQPPETGSGGMLACGVGCGGPMTPGGETVSPLNIPAWRDFPLRSRLGAALDMPVHVDNDAKALALAEGWVGAARGVTDYIAMVVSTGVGGGIVLDGRLLDGASSNAGHIGHLMVEPDGRECVCGARGCLEAEASGTAIAQVTGAPAVEAPVEVRRRVGMLVGRAVASVANLLDLRLAVVAGSVALGFGEDFFAAAREELGERARMSYATGARIEVAGLGASGPLVGGAAVAWRAVSREGGPDAGVPG